MANDDKNIPAPKRGAFPVPKEVLENAKPYKPDQTKPEDNPSGDSSSSPHEPQNKPDERTEEESPQPK